MDVDQVCRRPAAHHTAAALFNSQTSEEWKHVVSLYHKCLCQLISCCSNFTTVYDLSTWTWTNPLIFVLELSEMCQSPAEWRRMNRIWAEHVVPPNSISVWFNEFRVVNSPHAWVLWHQRSFGCCHHHLYRIRFDCDDLNLCEIVKLSAAPQASSDFLQSCDAAASRHNELVVWLWNARLHSSSLCTSSPFLVKTIFTPAARNVSCSPICD